ncbi:MAG TPA: peptide ABC transporter substrate-binding protein [bacterium]|nr:peptide ABC transporter substrate-binding protein [bacterium]
MAEWTSDPEQVALFRQRSDAVGISRRDFMKIVAAAAVGAGMVPAVGELMTPEAASAANPVPDAEQVLRSPWNIEPSSHDYNKDLYCGGDTELFAGLARFDPTNKVVPYVAERWETKANGQMYVYYLHKGVKWTNGDPVTAHDFEWSFKRQLDPATNSSYAAFLFDIQNAEAFNTKTPGITRDNVGVKALDDYTLQITLEGPRGYFPVLMAYYSSLPAHRPSVEKYGDKWTEAGNIVTNGPWKLTVWEHNKRLEYERNDAFILKPKPKLRKRICPIMVNDAQLPAYEAGEIDRIGVWASVPLAEIKRLKSDPRLSKEMHIFSETGTFYLAPSYTQPPFDNRGVRRAFAHAIDRDSIVKSLLQGIGQPAYTFVPPDAPGYLDPRKYSWIKEATEYNPKVAMDQLKGTPYEGGRNWPKVALTFRTDELGGLEAQVAQAIQAMLQENLNLSIDLEGLEGRVFYGRMWGHKIQLNYVRWYMDYPDPNDNLYMVWFSKRTGGSRHEYKDDEFDKLVEQAASAPTWDQRMALYAQAERRMLEDGAAVHIYYPFGVRLYKPWVQGVPKNAAGLPAEEWNVYRGLVNEIYIADVPGRPRLT